MTYATVSEADERLVQSEPWQALTVAQKNAHLSTAALWLNYSYVWGGKLEACPVYTDSAATALPLTFPITFSSATAARELVSPMWPRVCCDGSALVNTETGCEIVGVPHEVKMAQIFAAEQSASTALFAQPSVNDGQLIKKRVKAGSVEIEQQWSSADRGSGGEVILTNISAFLLGLGTRRGSTTGRIPMAFA